MKNIEFSFSKRENHRICLVCRWGMAGQGVGVGVQECVFGVLAAIRSESSAKKKTPAQGGGRSAKDERFLLCPDGFLESLVAFSVRREPEKGRARDQHVGSKVEKLLCVVQGHAAIDLNQGRQAA